MLASYGRVMKEWHAMEHRQDWIFTFGFGQESLEHGRLGHRFVRIYGTWDEARREMVRRHGLVWAFQYPSEDAAGVAKYHLVELES